MTDSTCGVPIHTASNDIVVHHKMELHRQVTLLWPMSSGVYRPAISGVVQFLKVCLQLFESFCSDPLVSDVQMLSDGA